LELNKLLKNTNARFILSTWHSNVYRKNTYLNTIWSDFNILTKEHFYHVGGYEKNRNPMLEALVINYDKAYKEDKKSKFEQLTLFEKC
jgi:DNA adenine methylase